MRFTIAKAGKTANAPSRFLRKTGKAIPQMILYAVMFGLAYIFLYPFLYMLVTSLMTNEDLNNSLVRWIPRELHIQNYSLAMYIIDYWKNLKNSAIVTILATAGQLVSCSMAGYALARFTFFGKRAAMFLVILAMLVPVQTIIAPQYLLYVNLGWLNTFNPLVIPSFFGFGLKGALFIYIFRQFFLGQPHELEEAARIDGCGFIRTFTRVVLPVARSVYVVVLVLALVWHWSDFFEPGMYLNKSNIQMVSMRLEVITNLLSQPAAALEATYGVTDTNTINDGVLMAGTFMVVLPILIVYGFLQKQFIQGIERTGLTGE